MFASLSKNWNDARGSLINSTLYRLPMNQLYKKLSTDIVNIDDIGDDRRPMCVQSDMPTLHAKLAERRSIRVAISSDTGPN